MSACLWALIHVRYKVLGSCYWVVFIRRGTCTVHVHVHCSCFLVTAWLWQACLLTLHVQCMQKVQLQLQELWPLFCYSLSLSPCPIILYSHTHKCIHVCTCTCTCRCDSQIESLSCEVIMRADRSLKCMVSMMSVCESMATQMCGSTLLTSSTISHSLH